MLWRSPRSATYFPQQRGSFAYYRDEVNLVIDCSGKVNPTASWSFEMRYALADAVAELPECTMEVVHIIFGSSRTLSKGKHTVDYAVLSDGVCAQLQAFVNLKSNLNVSGKKKKKKKGKKESEKESKIEKESDDERMCSDLKKKQKLLALPLVENSDANTAPLISSKTNLRCDG